MHRARSMDGWVALFVLAIGAGWPCRTAADPPSGQADSAARPPYLFTLTSDTPESDHDEKPRLDFSLHDKSPADDFKPPGFAGASGVRPTAQSGEGFQPVEDRWRIGFPQYDRLNRRSALDPLLMGAVSGDYAYVNGHWYDPYNQNVLKGDYPIFGQRTFFSLTLISDTTFEYRKLPTPSGESAVRPDNESFFRRGDQVFFNQNLIAKFDLFHGSAAFKPFDWKVRITPVFNLNFTDVEEEGLVNIDVRRGTYRRWKDFALQELFFETKLADVSGHYDFVSLRIGRQQFTSDFRGFIFNDFQQGVRLFGNSDSNRIQWNLAYFYIGERDTNSGLLTWDGRDQQVVVANVYIQDSLDFEFLPPQWRKGYTTQFSVHYSHDDQGTEPLHFDRNGFLARPDPIGSFTPHDVKVAYLGWTGDGHIGALNLTHAFYWALGRDDFNPLAGRKVTVNAQMFAVEASYERDWMRFRSSFMWASGDHSPSNTEARGFDAIFEDANFAGGPFSFWNRQAVRLLGVDLVGRNSMLPSLSSNKTEGQSNFVNPGLFLANAGFDAEITPQLKAIVNANYSWFAHTDSLELFLQQPDISREIGFEASMGLQYRPLLNNNVIFNVGVSAFWPGEGFQQIYETDKTLYSVFTQLTMSF